MSEDKQKKSTHKVEMEEIVNLCKRRGFIFPGSEIYGGMANSWDYGPLGVELKNNIKRLWWKMFVQERPDMVGIDAALIMNPKVWEASGHLENFTDPLIECKKCHTRFRMDKLIEDVFKLSAQDAYGLYLRDWFNSIEPKLKTREQLEWKKIQIAKKMALPKKTENYKPSIHKYNALNAEVSAYKKLESEGLASFYNKLVLDKDISCTVCEGRDFTKPKSFNLMFKTFIGPAEEQSNVAYFRPETAQAMFVDFKNVLTTTRRRIPFGIAQIGKAFRNEITPGNFIFRTREFEQMEIEYFIREGDWKESFEYWLGEMKKWMKIIGVPDESLHFAEIPDGERAHYSKRTIDIEFAFPFGVKELYGLAYRTDFDLKNHQDSSGTDLSYQDPQTGEKFVPHVIEPTFGVDRTVLAVLTSAYHKEMAPTGEGGQEERVVLRIPYVLAPVQVAVLPLSKKEELSGVAQDIAATLRKSFRVEYDDTQSIGRRYRRQDEVGTPYCVTVDFDSLEDKKVTVRDRDTMQQERVAIEQLSNFLRDKYNECQ